MQENAGERHVSFVLDFQPFYLEFQEVERTGSDLPIGIRIVDIGSGASELHVKPECIILNREL